METTTKSVRATCIEPLEGRFLLSVVLPVPLHFAGTLFHDANRNSIVDAGETVFGGVTIFQDSNANGQLDDQEPQTTSNDDGTFAIDFVGLALSGRLRVIPPSGWSFNNWLQPGITLGPARNVTGLVSGDSARIFSNVTIFDDLNGNNQLDDFEDRTTTDASGHYALFTGAPTSRIAVIAPAGFREYLPPPFTLIDIPRDSRDFRLVLPAKLRGTLFEDANLNGARDPGETAISGVKIFADENGNDTLDQFEQLVVTDSQGRYSFDQLGLGIFRLRLANLAGWSILRPGPIIESEGQQLDLDVPVYRSKTVTGFVFNDIDRDGIRDEGEGGLFGVAVRGFNSPPADGSHNVIIEVGPYPPDIREILRFSREDGSFELFDVPLAQPQISVDGVPYAQQLGLDPEAIRLQIVNEVDPEPSVVRGRVFDDANGNGIMDGGEKPMAGVKVTLSPSLLSGPPFTIFRTNRSIPTTTLSGSLLAVAPFILSATTDAEGNFLFANLSGAKYALKITSTPQAADSTPVFFTLGSGADKTVNLPAHPYAIIAGKIRAYTQPNSSIGDSITVYLDRNNNGRLDRGEEWQFTHTGSYRFERVANGPYAIRVIADHKVRSTLKRGIVTPYTFVNHDIQLDYRTALVKFSVYLDKNGNGRRDFAEAWVRRAIFDIDYNQNGKIEPQLWERWPSVRDKDDFRFDVRFGTTRITVRTGDADNYSSTLTMKISDYQTKHALIGLQKD